MARKKKDETLEDNTMTENETTETVESTEAPETVESTEAPVKSKRDIVAETIAAGGATMESLMAAADCKYASVMSIFSMLRLMGKCPVKDVLVTQTDEDGNEVEVLTYRLVSMEEWEAIKAEKASNAKTARQPKKSPEEQLTALATRVERLTKASDAAAVRASDYPDNEILQLRAKKASLELQIAELEYAELNDKMNS